MSDSAIHISVARVLGKSGARKVHHKSVPRKSIKFIKDVANTWIECSWKRVLLTFVGIYFFSWTFFACLYLLIAWAHNDLNFDPVTGKRMNDGLEPCLHGGDTFTDVFMLSMESQVSTGYGEHYPTEECSEAIFLLIAQLITGVIIDGCLVGTFYAKMVRPPRKNAEVKFSSKAVICLRDGKLCLIFRVVDPSQQHGIKTKVKAFFFETRSTREGESLEKAQRRLDLQQNGKLFLIWPETVCHVIDSTSPLYDLSAEQLLQRQFEIGVSLVGDSRKTGQFVQARTSYVPSEILWGQRFVNAVDYDGEYHEYVVDAARFNQTVQVPTPLCSAKHLDDLENSMKHESSLEALRNYEIKHLEEFNEEDEEDEDDTVPEYSEENDLDIVEDMVSLSQLPSKMITRTTSVVQNYNRSNEYVDDAESDYSKSLTHIERERERAKRPQRLKKARGQNVKLQSSDQSSLS